MAVNVWAESRDVPNSVCSDARLAAGSAGPIEYPEGSPHGQAGWDIGLRFEDLKDLAKKLGGVKKTNGAIGRLAIHAHGQMNGVLYVEGAAREKNALTPESLQVNKEALNVIGSCIPAGGIVLLMGCIAGLGPGGSRLVKGLSKLWPGISVVAFTTIGYVNTADMLRKSRCTEPGMRDTRSSNPTDPATQERVYKAQWNDLRKLPWQSEKSDSAKIAVNGAITKGSKDEGGEPESMPYWLDRELSDAWNRYIRCKAFNYQSSCIVEQSKFMRTKDGPDRKDYNWTGNSGPDGNQPPWKDNEQNQINYLRSLPQRKPPIQPGRPR